MAALLPLIDGAAARRRSASAGTDFSRPGRESRLRTSSSPSHRDPVGDIAISNPDVADFVQPGRREVLLFGKAWATTLTVWDQQKVKRHELLLWWPIKTAETEASCATCRDLPASRCGRSPDCWRAGTVTTGRIAIRRSDCRHGRAELVRFAPPPRRRRRVARPRFDAAASWRKQRGYRAVGNTGATGSSNVSISMSSTSSRRTSNSRAARTPPGSSRAGARCSNGPFGWLSATRARSTCLASRS